MKMKSFSDDFPLPFTTCLVGMNFSGRHNARAASLDLNTSSSLHLLLALRDLSVFTEINSGSL